MQLPSNKAPSWLLQGPFNVIYEVKNILGDPGADKGDEGKSKRAEKYIWNEEK